jgi:hypothetical protein
MSRFNNPKALLNRPEEQPRTIIRPDPVPKAKVRERVSLILEPPSSETSIGQRLGFALLCVFCVSGYANDFAVQSLGGKAYISTVAFAVLPIMLVLSGNLLRGFRDITGRIWLLFIFWVCVAVPFSVWKGGSVALLLAYVPHNWIQLYYFAAFVSSSCTCYTNGRCGSTLWRA